MHTLIQYSTPMYIQPIRTVTCLINKATFSSSVCM